MPRKKLELTYIENDSKRRETLRKRKSSLIKKVEEITTLCGIDVCAIIHSPHEPQPEVWPSPLGAASVISKFREIPELEQSKKMMDQEKFLEQMIQKAQQELKKRMDENRKNELNILMLNCLGASEVIEEFELIDLNDLSKTIDQKLKEINQKIDSIQAQEGTTNDGEVVINEDQAQVEVMEKIPWVEKNIINGGEGHEVQPIGDATNL